MLLRLELSGDTPVYQQIRNQVVAAIASGDLRPGERLPTIRALAEEKECALVDVAEALTGEDGCLPRNLTFEGIHLNTAGCRVWLEYLRTHSVEEKK